MLPPVLTLAEKVILITGGAQGLGAVTATVCAALGAHVVIADIQSDTRVADSIIAGGGRATQLELDVTRQEDWVAASTRTIDSLGRIDGLVNNAGITHRVPLQKITPEEWARVFDINVSGMFLGVQEIGKHMEDAGRGGSIVNVSSALGLIGHAATAYSSAKWAVRGLTRSAAGLLSESSIRVNSVHPG